MKNLKILSGLLLVLLFLSMLRGASYSQESITLRISWWGSQTRHDRTLKVLELYTQKINPRVKFEPEFGAFSGYWDKLAVQAAARNLPDIIQIGYGYLEEYAGRGLLADISPLVEKKIISFDDTSPAIKEAGMVDGKLYAVCLGMNAWAIAYDPAVAEKAGVRIPTTGLWTWNDYKRIVKEVYKKTGLKAELPFMDEPTNILSYYLQQNGLNLYNSTGTGLGFSDPKYVKEVLELFLDLIKSGASPDPAEYAVTTSLEDSLFVKGKAWLYWLWSNQVVALANAAKRPIKLALPPKGKYPGLFLNPSQFFVISANSKYKEEAGRFINFFVNDIEANKILLAERGVPTSAKVRKALKSIVDPIVKQTFDYMDLAAKNSMPTVPRQPAKSSEIKKLGQEIFQKVFYGELTPEKGALEFMRRANEILQSK